MAIPSNQMDQAATDPIGLQSKLLGPDYNYSKQINSPTELGMSSAGNFDALTNDISGLIAYVNVLVTGKGKGSKTGQPLGTKFFLETPMKCTDKVTGKEVKRSIYINNIPDGSIPFITAGMGVTFDDFKGLVPGLVSNLAQINPMQILGAFVTGSSPTCQAITMETVDSNNKKDTKTKYVSNIDILSMNPKWFPSGVRPDTTESKQKKNSGSGSGSGLGLETFCAMQNETSSLIEPNTLKGANIDYSKMPDDFFIKIYFSAIGLLGFYIFLKILLRKRK